VPGLWPSRHVCPHGRAGVCVAARHSSAASLAAWDDVIKLPMSSFVVLWLAVGAESAMLLSCPVAPLQPIAFCSLLGLHRPLIKLPLLRSKQLCLLGSAPPAVCACVCWACFGNCLRLAVCVVHAWACSLAGGVDCSRMLTRCLESGLGSLGVWGAWWNVSVWVCSVCICVSIERVACMHFMQHSLGLEC